MKIDYDPEIHIEFALQLLEGDVGFLSRRYHIPSYDQEDLQQELRLQICKIQRHYDYDKAGIRAWANNVMRNHLRNLLIRSKAKKRGSFVDFNEEEHVYELDLDLLIDKFNEKGKKLGDYL